MFALALSNVELFVVYVFYAVYSLPSLSTPYDYIIYSPFRSVDSYTQIKHHDHIT